MTNEDLKLASYKTSKDYRHLAKIARNQNIICIVDFNLRGEKIAVRDIAQTAYRKTREYEYFQIFARGTGYINAFSEEEFIRYCEALNVEFIEPTTIIHGDI